MDKLVVARQNSFAISEFMKELIKAAYRRTRSKPIFAHGWNWAGG